MGRRQTLWVAMALISAGAVLQASSFGVPRSLFELAIPVD